MELSNEAIKREFAQVFGDGGWLRIVRAPGRVNLIGEHVDYNEGLVFPMAIEPQVKMVFRMREDMKVRLGSTAFAGEVAEFDVAGDLKPVGRHWSNYSRGVTAEMVRAGMPLTGMDALICNTLPVGSGLSSSAAILVATACCYLALGGFDIEQQRLALICLKAEHEFAGVPCGIMDQTIVIGGRKGFAMLLDCRDQARQYVPIDENELKVMIAYTNVHHELSAGEYGKRKAQCEQGLEYFKKVNPLARSLRDVTAKQVEESTGKLDDVVHRRCKHVVSEIARTAEAATMLSRRDYERVGELMAMSHASLRDDYEVSCPELDFLAAEAGKFKGVYGARMTGGGFGGCIIALVQPKAVESLTAQLKEAYLAGFGKQAEIYISGAADGAGVLRE